MVFIGLSQPVEAAVSSAQARRVLSKNCFPCHGPDEEGRKADLRLDNASGAFANRDGHAPIVPGRPEESLILERILAEDPDDRMPPPEADEALSQEDVEILREWIASGAEYRAHWAFQTPNRPEIPEIESEWVRNPIDAFILERMRAQGLTPNPMAAPGTRLRRAALTLTGLALGDEFADVGQSREDYERVVDRLLKSKRYGERRAQFWLDAARYGDTHGLHLDNERAIWPYRDWVISAFNENMPFDRFAVDQIAGDLAETPSREELVATGFNRCNVTTSEGGAIPEEFRVRYGVDRVNTLGTVFMGLTVGCAQCHDHKYDPLTQRDYYQLFHIYNQLDENPMDGNSLTPPPSLKLPSEEQEREMTRLDEAISGIEDKIRDAIESIQLPESESAAPVASGDEGEATEERDWVSLRAWIRFVADGSAEGVPEKLVAYAKKAAEEREAAEKEALRNYFVRHVYAEARPVFEPLNESLVELRRQRDQLKKQIPVTLITRELEETRPSYILERGEYDRRGESVEPGIPGFLETSWTPEISDRRDVAKWLTDPRHPLTARVTMNRLWRQVFGRGLVSTVDDFGTQGAEPSHPKALDWLAVEFIESGWNVKHMMRLMVTSSTFQQSSHRQAGDVPDPENVWLSRGPKYRLDAEAIRDNALNISGLLSDRMGGHPVKPYQPEGLWKAVAYPTSTTAKFSRDDGEALYRRSVYTFIKRTAPPPAMAMFDAPNRETCVVARERTNTPMQALVGLNDPQMVEASRHFAESIYARAQNGSVEEALDWAFLRTTGRSPSEDELARLLATCEELKKRYQNQKENAVSLLSIGASRPSTRENNESMAAYTLVASLLLNLDETLTLN